MLRLVVIVLLLNSVGLISSTAKTPELSTISRSTKPSRIIRTCCSFGADMQLFAIPGLKLTEITSIERIGPHHYLGNPDEQNGIIYTRRGGFIDMGHLRDQCDWLAYIYTQLLDKRKTGVLHLILGHEGGEKTLQVRIAPELTNQDLIFMAGKIAYDLSVWHEIATWYGASTIPFVPERYSSFSVEDAYSNLLGVMIGIKAVQSELPYEQAVTKIIDQTLRNLDVVKSETETLLAMEDVRNIWWTRDKRLPSGKVLLQRQLSVYPCLRPWLVPGWENLNQDPIELKVPEFTSKGEKLDTYYSLEFRLNYKFPYRKLFPDRKERNITQMDFDSILTQIAAELTKKDQNFQ